jgi:hypothetical protein
MELDQAQELTVKRLAKARFGGDEDAAYEAILETGLEHTLIPQIDRPSLTPEGEPRIHYTDRQNKTNPCIPVLPETPSVSPFDNLQILQTESTDSQRLHLPELLSELATICQYDGVDYDRLAFSIADSDGNWYGWGVNTLATALQATAARYDDVSREPGKAENVELLLPVRDSQLHVGVTHEIQREALRLSQFNFYTSGNPVGYEPSLQAIAGHYDRRLTVSEPVARGFSVRTSISVPPRQYLIEEDTEMVNRLVIDCPKSELPDVLPDQDFDPLPAECVMGVMPYVSPEAASDTQYWLTAVDACRLPTGTWALQLDGTPDDLV